MGNQQTITQLIKSLAGQANILTIPRVYMTMLTNDITAALLLGQIVYWSDKSSRTDGWFYKSYTEWHEEIGLTQFQVSRAAKLLVKLGVLDTKVKRANKSPTVHYKLNYDELINLIIEFLDNQQSQQTDYQETSQTDYQETSQTLTETTQRLQQKIKGASAAPRMFENDEQEALWIYAQVTGLTAFPGRGPSMNWTPRLCAIVKQSGGMDAAIELCKPLYDKSLKTRTKDGRLYFKTNDAWVDWALAGGGPNGRHEREEKFIDV